MASSMLAGRAMRAATNLFFGQGCKPAFDLIEPGRRGWREMNLKARVARKPVADGWRLVRAVVVHHEMNVQISGNGCLNRAQEFQEFATAMAPVQLPYDSAGRDVQSGKQSCRAMTLVVVGAPFSDTGRQRQNGLRPVECLNLAFFIDAQHHGLQRRINVQAHDVAGLLDKQGVGGEFERLLTVRLQTESAPNPADRCLRQLRLACHRACTPMGGIHRLPFQRLGDDGVHARVVYRSRCP